MDLCITYIRPDGGVSVVNPAPSERFVLAVVEDGVRIAVQPGTRMRGFVPTGPDSEARLAHLASLGLVYELESDEDFAARMALRDVPAGLAWRVKRKADLPSRRFRDAWEAPPEAPDAVNVNLVKARQQVLTELRLLRKVLLDESEALKSQAEDVGTPQQRNEVREYRQKLRDLPDVATSQIANLSLAELESYATSVPPRPTVGP